MDSKQQTPDPPSTASNVNVVVVKQQPVQQPRSSGGLFGSLERAFNQVGKDIDRAIHLSITDKLRPGIIIQLQSKLNGKNLRILENGYVDCLGDGGTACQYTVVAGTYPNAIKLQNVAQPNKYLAIIQEYLVGYGQGGTDCEVIPSVTLDGQYAMLESAIQPGAHVGALPSGQITSPPQTSKTTDASQFRVIYVGRAV